MTQKKFTVDDGIILNTGSSYNVVIESYDSGNPVGNNQQYSVAVGSGPYEQGGYATAIGYGAGWTEQGNGTVAVGYQAGNTNQGHYSVAIGYQAGSGYGVSPQGNNSIIINATGSPLDGNPANSFIVSPVRQSTTDPTLILSYNTTSKEISYSDVLSSISISQSFIANNITSNSYISATGNITAGNIISDGEVISEGRAYVRYLDIRGGGASGTIGTLGYSGNIPQLYGTAGIQIVTSDEEGGPQWEFDTSGTLTAPGNITATGNVSADRILTNSLLSDTDVFVQALDGVVDIRANANVVIKSADANYEWVFDTNGVLTTPGDIDIGGRLTSTTGQLNLEAADNPNAYIQLNDTGDSLFGAAGNLSLLTDGDSQEWIFRTDGTLSLPGATAFMDASANFVGIYPDASQNNGIELYTTATEIFNTGNVNVVANVAGTAKTWTFANTGAFTSPGAISATGNITGGNIDTDGQITVDALSITNSSIAAVTQFTISTSNTATGNSSSILMDRNGVGVVVQLEDTGGGPYSWGLYQDNILFPDGSRQYSAYGNANVVANLAALGSNPISTTGNVSAGNFIGAGSNVELVAGSYTWTFDNTGNAAFANGTVTANDITLTGNIDANVGGYNIGYREIPQVTLSANANVALADSGKHFYSTTAGNLSLLIPTNANVAFPTGTAFTIVVQAAGNVLVNADSGVNLYLAGNSTAGNRVVSTYGMATVMKVATDTWFINGTGVA